MLTEDLLSKEVDKFHQLVSQSKPETILSRLDCDRWVTAHESAEAAFPMFLSALEWRKMNKIDQVLTGPISPSVEKQIRSEKAVVLPDHIRDNSDRPVIVCNPTRHDKKTKLKHTIEHIVYCLETVCSIADKNGVRDICVILNLDKFGVVDMDYSIAKAGLKILVNYYPERLGCLYIINTPSFFHACFKIIQKWIYQRTRDKIHFVQGRVNIDEYVKNGSLPPELFVNKHSSEPSNVDLE